MEQQRLSEIYEHLFNAWFQSLKVGDKVYNYSSKWKNGEVVEEKLREGVIKEVGGKSDFACYVIVDNLTTGRQNKWNDFDLVKPKELQDLQDQLLEFSRANYDRLPKPEAKPSFDPLAQSQYESLLENADVILQDETVRLGKCRGIYGAFNKKTNECIYIGKSNSSIATRWREHARYWKKLRPIHRQPLLTKYLHFFGEKIEWRVLLPFPDDIELSNDLVEYCERRLFEKYQPIANSIVPNGTFYGRSVLENEGDTVSVSEWNPTMVEIRIKKGEFNGFSDGKNHFDISERDKQ